MRPPGGRPRRSPWPRPRARTASFAFSRAAAPSRARSGPSTRRRSIAARSSRVFAGGDHDPVGAVLDCVREPSDAARDDGSSIRHGFTSDNPVALPPGRDADDGGALEVGTEPIVGDEPDGLRDTTAERAVPDDHPRKALGRLQELEDPLLLAEPPGEEHVRRVVRARRPPRGSRPRSGSPSRPERPAVSLRRRGTRRPRRPPAPGREAGGRDSEPGARARRRCPTPAARTAFGSRAPEAPKGSSGRARRPRPSTLAARRARTSRGRAAGAGRATARPGGSGRSRRRRRSRSGGSRRARRRRPRPPRASAGRRRRRRSCRPALPAYGDRTSSGHRPAPRPWPGAGGRQPVTASATAPAATFWRKTSGVASARARKTKK